MQCSNNQMLLHQFENNKPFQITIDSKELMISILDQVAMSTSNSTRLVKKESGAKENLRAFELLALKKATRL